MKILVQAYDWLATPAGAEFLLALGLALLYWLAVLLIRWHLIARPVLRNLQARIRRVRAEIDEDTKSLPGVPQALARRVKDLLNDARQPTETLNWWDRLFWNRGQEVAGWQLVHEAERRGVAMMSAHEVHVRLTTALEELRGAGNEACLTLAARIEALRKRDAQPIDERPLLDETLRILYKDRDQRFFVLVNWYNKLNLLGPCALALIVALTGALGHSVLFLAGAAGGFLSRLTRQLKAPEMARDYESGWTELFLSPLFGALAGWSGVLLISALTQDDQYLGSAFKGLKDVWKYPYSPAALTVALLMGLTERAFDKVVRALEERLPGGGSEAKKTAPSRPAAAGEGKPQPAQSE